MAVNTSLSFTHLNGGRPETDESVAASWDRAFAKAAGPAGTTTRPAILSGWNRAFAQATGKPQGGQS